MDAKLRALVARRSRIAGVLTAIMLIAYFGFIALVAFGKDSAGTLLGSTSISLGIALGAGLIILAPILTTIYVRWANHTYDKEVASLKKGEPRE